MDALPAAIYTTDAAGRVTYFNNAAAELWGREPELGQDLWCGSWKIFRPDGVPMALDACPMAVSLREGRPVRGEEIIIERPDGSRRHVLPHPTPIFDAAGALIGGINLLADVTEHRATETARALLGTIVESSDDAIISKSLDGVIRSWNAGAARIFGYTAEEIIGRPITTLIPPDRLHEEPEILSRLLRGERIDHYETIRMTKDGRRVDISITVSPVRDGRGVIIGASKVARDITDRKQREAELARYRNDLEAQVVARTSQLQKASQQLRLTERVASLGTLSAGLGHDVANLLVPLRVRLESLSRAELSPEQREDVDAIRTTAEYLQRLANGLRLLASDPARASPNESTSISSWWTDVGLLLKNVLPRGVELKWQPPASDYSVAMSRAALTQAVYNIVQNAGDALRERGTGTVSLSAEADETTVRLSVTDDGPGMSPEVQARCMEPFYTTKPRGLSTGLGLVLVYGLVRDAGGSISLESGPGMGTTFVITLRKAAARVEKPAGPPRVAVVRVKDLRIQAFISAELAARGFIVGRGNNGEGRPALIVIDDPDEVPPEVDAKAVVLLGASRSTRPGVIALDGPPKPQKIREAITRLTRE